jgi:hypothetical protein
MNGRMKSIATMSVRVTIVLFFSYIVACAASPSAPSSSPATQSAHAPEKTIEGSVEWLREDARRVRPLVHTPFANRFLDAADSLPHVPPHDVYRSKDKSRWLTADQFTALADAERTSFDRVTVDEPLYYETKYGSPLAYARAFEVLAQHGFASPSSGGAYARPGSTWIRCCP